MRKGRSRWEKGEWGGPPPPFVQVVAAAAGLSGGNCLLQGRLAASFGRCRSLWRQLSAAGPL